MILSFSVKNFRSFASETEIYFAKRNLKTNHPKDGNWPNSVNLTSGIFGANASGKTSLINALQDICKLPSFSMGRDFYVKNLRQPHKLLEEQDVEFFLDFVHQDKRYRWDLSIGKRGITQETVWVSESRQFKLVFQRNLDEIDFGASSGISAEVGSFIKQGSTNWVSSTSPWIKAKDSGKYAAAFKWLSENVTLIDNGRLARGMMSPFVNRLLSNGTWRELAIQALRFADVGVMDVELEEVELPAPQRKAMKRLAEFLNESLDIDDSDDLHFVDPDKEIILNFKHEGPDDSEFELKLKDESTGTQVWLESILPALFVILRGGVLLVDEIDSSLHPLLVRQMISLFSDDELNHKGAQVVFTSHDLTLLGNFPVPAISLESSWLCSKEKSFSSIKSIDEYKLPKTANAEKRYMQGAFGAVPLTAQPHVIRDFYELLGTLEEQLLTNQEEDNH